MNKKDTSISLAKFLSRYMMLEGEGLKTLSHKDIKEQFPDIKRCSMQDAEILYLEGKVIFVHDGKYTLPYLIPKREKITTTFINMSLCPKKKPNRVPINYADMTIHELLCLLNTRLNRKSVSRQARAELEERGYTLKRTYKAKRNEDIIKSLEKDFNE